MMEEKKYNIEQLKKAKKPDVPQGFFENFSSEMISIIEVEEKSLIFEKSKQPKVPDEFFNEFPNKILERVENKKSSKTKIIFLAIAVAASFLLLFNLKIFKNQKINEPSEVFIVKESESDLELLSYFTLEELIDYQSESVSVSDDDELDELYNEVKNHWSFYE